jgi:hypothetical protein
VIGLDARRLVFATAIIGADGRPTNAVVQVAFPSRRIRVLPLAGGPLMRNAAFMPFAPVSVAPPRVALTAATRRADEVLVVAGGDAAERVAVVRGRAPRTGGRFRSLGAMAVGPRTALFAATVVDGRTDGGIFLWRRGRVRSVLLEGSGAPGGGTVELISDEDVPLVLDGRRGAFIVPVVVDGIPRATLFVTDGRLPALVAREGDPTPAGTIGPFGAPGSLALAGTRVVCASPLSGAGAAAVLFACDDLRCD